MPKDRALYLVANSSAILKFSPRFMVAHAKRRKVAQRKGRPASRRERASRAHAPSKRRAAAAATHKPPRKEKAVKAEELAAEEVVKPEEVELAPAAADSESEEVLAPRERERGSYDGDTAIKLYLREIGQVKLLTPQEEIVLAARIKRGDKKARELMIKANLRLVVKIARDYEGIGLPLLDLISEGNIGLMKAVERFDPAKGGKLSTYGSWWIKQSIKRALANQSKTIRLPVHLVDKISKMRRTAMRLQEELGREPTDEELGEELGITASRVSQMRMAAIRPASLDAPIGDEDSNNFAEVVQDESADTPYQPLRSGTMIGYTSSATLSRVLLQLAAANNDFRDSTGTSLTNAQMSNVNIYYAVTYLASA